MDTDDKKIETVCDACLDWNDFSSGNHTDYPCDGCRFADADYRGDRSPRLINEN